MGNAGAAFMSRKRQIGDIVKSNKLIEAKYDLTLLEQKIILLAISKINPSSKDKKVSVRVREFCALTGSTQDRYIEIRQVLRNLRKKEILITWYDNDGEIKEELIAGWINTALYRNGTVDISFPEELMPYLVELQERFTVYNIKNIANMNSKHSIRLYEILKEQELRGGFVIELNRLKELICGLDKFDRYFDFRKRVLDTAQKEIKEKADIYFNFREIRNGKSVVSIEFEIFKNNEIIEKREKEKSMQEMFDYYGTDNVEKVIDNYKSKTKEELVDELCELFIKRYNLNFSKEELLSYDKSIITKVIFGIVEGTYKDIQKPLPYFRAVLSKEKENLCR